MLERIVRSLVIASAILGASGAFAADLSSNTCNRHRWHERNAVWHDIHGPCAGQCRACRCELPLL